MTCTLEHRVQEEGAGLMALYYWTTSPELKSVYHDKQECPEGRKILMADRTNSDIRPINRTPCEVCPTASN
jgi:hypothetical protein